MDNNFDHYMEMILRGSAIVKQAEKDGLIDTKEQLRKSSHVDKEVKWDRGMIYINPTISQIKQVAEEFAKFNYDESTRALIYNGNFYIGDQKQIHEDILNYVDSRFGVRKTDSVNIYDIYVGTLSLWQYKTSHNTFYLSESYSSEINKIYTQDTINISGTRRKINEGEKVESSDVINFFRDEVNSISSVYKTAFNFVFKIISSI